MAEEVYTSEGAFNTTFDYKPAPAETQPPASTVINGYNLPADITFTDLLGVSYGHLKTCDGGDLFLTKYGLPFWEHLQPENWYAREWFETKRERLIGTSVVYKVPTRQVRGKLLDLVVKWSRVGEDVPMDTLTINKFINAEFNSPFEEFSLLMELRAGASGPPGIRIRTQRPLAIYVPSERLQLWQTNRSESKIAAKIAQSPAVELDILRQYVVLYGWIKGMDLPEVAEHWKLTPQAREEFLARTTSLVTHELELKGYHVVDMKPAHIIVRMKEGNRLLRNPHGEIIYAVVDYELMERTPTHEASVRSVHRQHYLQHMAKRFEITAAKPMPAHLRASNVLGVDYIYGHAESTGGLLWVVGKDPDLFNYFLPERWRRTPKCALSPSNRVFHTRTKDSVFLVWKVSRMGDVPWLIGAGSQAREVLDHGYNSPFEEFAYALELSRLGVSTVYPRAIYMTGHRTDSTRNIADRRRYQSFEHILTPDGQPLLRNDHDYITIWGFWNGPDEYLAAQDGAFYRGVNADQACQEQLITPKALEDMVDRKRERMALVGFEDLNLKPDHLLLSFAPDNSMVKDTMDKPAARICNLELVRRIVKGRPVIPANDRA